MSDIEREEFERIERHFNSGNTVKVEQSVIKRADWILAEGHIKACAQYLQVMINELTDAMARMEATTSQADECCTWTQDHSDGLWEAACGYSLMLDGQGPEENGIKYCPECGKPCVAIEPTEEQDR